MKRFHKKSLVLLAALTLLLTVTVSGTVAFLSVSSGPVTNTFTPVQVDTVINETVSKGEKSSITVTNKDLKKNIPVYVRVAVYGNWVDATGKILQPWSVLSSYNTAYWEESGGYYYYKSELAVGATTSNLLEDPITDAEMPAGADHLEVVVVHQAIQSQPIDAVKSAWGWNPGTGN